MRRGSFQTIAILLLCCLLYPAYASAHAILTNASPAYNSQLDHSPSEIVLTFNERLQKDLYRIELFDTTGHVICCEKASLSADQRQIKLKLPELEQGHFTVTYAVISTDGHPIQESYVFTIGTPLSPVSDITIPGTSLHAGHSVSGPEGFWAYRIFYFFALLLMSGWVLWRHWIPMEHPASLTYKRVGRYLQLFHMVTLIGLIIYQLSSFLLGWTFLELIQLLPHTLTGLSWILSISLVLTGLYLLQRWLWLDLLWIGLLLFSKCINGHAAASTIPWVTVILDFIHLLAAALWVSGLAYFMIFKKNKAKLFYPVFSKVALYCIVLLVLTGSLYTLMILPTLQYLFYTTWGILLLCKIVLVLLVVITGFQLRKNIQKQNQSEVSRWLRFDITWMMSIVVIAAIFSYLNPIPANEPLIWNETKNQVQMNSEISPMQIGTNRFSVEIALPLQDQPPKQVELWLTSNSKAELAPIAVPLTLSKRDTLNNKNLFNYTSEGPYLPFPSHWQAEVKVFDAQDNEMTFTKSFRLLP